MTAHSSEELEAIQSVVDRVTSWQDGATERTVESELRNGLEETGVELDDQEVAALASAIEDQHGAIRALEVLGGDDGEGGTLHP
jgi:hypothetical protein